MWHKFRCLFFLMLFILDILQVFNLPTSVLSVIALCSSKVLLNI